ncbi:MAG: CsiV family protein, partial [Gammaproteobacteria bacterium]|nr:CsiV family protein [Gammaproteobacteria bacterium]
IEYPPRFQVEIIVFRPLNPTPGNEQFAPPYDPFATESLDELDALLSVLGEADESDTENLDAILDDLADQPADNEDALQLAETELTTVDSDPIALDLDEEEDLPPRKEPQIVIDEDLWQLADLIERIENSRDFALLTYQVWQQDGVLLDEADPFILQPVDNEAGLLEGTATLSLSRFLHLLLDLEWLPQEKNEVFPLYPAFASLMAKQTPYVIKESRLMRGGAIHYFDHPHFGVVALITRVEEPEPELVTGGNPIIPAAAGINNTRPAT